MKNFEVGQKVMVRSDLVGRKDYKHETGRTIWLNPKMKDQYGGKEVTINKFDTYSNCYRIKEDDGYWSWASDMFEEVKPVKLVEPIMERKVLLLETEAKLEIYVSKVIVQDPAIILFYRPAVYDKDSVFVEWGNEKKVVAKCNKDEGDKFDIEKGVRVAMFKAYKKEIDKHLRKA